MRSFKLDPQRMNEARRLSGLPMLAEGAEVAVEPAAPVVEAGPVPIGKGDNGYIAFYKGRRVEVMANTKLEAQQTAAKFFNTKKAYDVTVELAEVGGKQVVHTATEAVQNLAYFSIKSNFHDVIPALKAHIEIPYENTEGDIVKCCPYAGLVVNTTGSRVSRMQEKQGYTAETILTIEYPADLKSFDQWAKDVRAYLDHARHADVSLLSKPRKPAVWRGKDAAELVEAVRPKKTAKQFEDQYMQNDDVQDGVRILSRLGGKDKAKTLALAASLLEDVNYHSLIRDTEWDASLVTDKDRDRLYKVSQMLDYGILEAAAVAVLLMRGVGDTQQAKAWLDTAVEDWAKW